MLDYNFRKHSGYCAGVLATLVDPEMNNTFLSVQEAEELLSDLEDMCNKLRYKLEEITE